MRAERERVLPRLAGLEAAADLGDDPLDVTADKLGGRNYYAPLIQQAFPDGWVRAERESARCYRVTRNEATSAAIEEPLDTRQL